MNISVATKVTSLSSQHSGAGTPSVPNPTPATDALDDVEVQAPDPVDLAAVTNILVPIQEELNDIADEAMYPSPPINTPEALSPAPSIVARQQQGRTRGLSGIGDRIAEIKLGRKCPRSDTASHRSAGAHRDDSVSVGDVLSDDGSDNLAHGLRGKNIQPLFAQTRSDSSVPIALGSPMYNPRIDEYTAFEDGSPPVAIAPITASLLEDSASSIKTLFDDDSINYINGKRGVTEKSNWAEEVEDHLDRACLRLEQLAYDEHVVDPSKTVEDYYIARLERLLGCNKRVVPVNIHRQASELHE